MQHGDESVADRTAVVHSASQRDIRHVPSSSSSSSLSSAVHRSVTFHGFDNLQKLTGFILRRNIKYKK